MKLGFLTACLPQLGLQELVPWASRQGFQTLELAAWPVRATRDYQGRQIDAARFNSAKAERIKELFSLHRMRISAMAYYDNNLDPNPRMRTGHLEHLKKVIDAAALLDVNLVGTFVGGRPDRTPSENLR